MPGRTVSNFVRAVLPARDGSLWFGREEGGLVRLREGVTTVFDRAEGLPAGRVNHLLEAADGGIWVTGKNWPFLYRIEPVPAAAPAPAAAK